MYLVVPAPGHVGNCLRTVWKSYFVPPIIFLTSSWFDENNLRKEKNTCAVFVMAHLRLTPLPSLTWISSDPKIFTWNMWSKKSHKTLWNLQITWNSETKTETTGLVSFSWIHTCFFFCCCWKLTLGWSTLSVSIRDIFCRALTFVKMHCKHKCKHKRFCWKHKICCWKIVNTKHVVGKFQKSLQTDRAHLTFVDPSISSMHTLDWGFHH